MMSPKYTEAFATFSETFPWNEFSMGSPAADPDKPVIA